MMPGIRAAHMLRILAYTGCLEALRSKLGSP